MRDAGLELAIKAAGGVGSLARGLGIAQPSVSAWSRIPAERVLAVEELTQVERFVLRPDLYGSPEAKPYADVDEIDQLRAAEYGLLSLLLGKAPDADTLHRVATLKGDASDLGMAHVELAAAAAATDDRAASKEFFDLFIGLGRGELLPYASYYLTGFLHERPLARVREDLGALGIERAGTSREPEDHIAILLEVIAGLARNDFTAEFAEQARFFERHLKPWAARMFADLEMSQSARFYRAVGRAGRVFMELEAEAFTLSEATAKGNVKEEIAMSKPSDDKGKSRAPGVDRRSLFLMGGSAVAAAAVVPLAGSEADADESQSERVKARYKETDHVKNFYRVNRY